MRVAMLPRGLDGIFLPPVPGVEILALVQRDTPEEAWARRVYPPERVLPYALRGRDLGPYPPTADLLARSSIDAVMRRSGAGALLLSASCAPETLAWAERHGVRLLMSDYRQQRRLEDKIAFDALLRRHGIPRPEGGPVTLGRGDLPARGAMVIQVPDSMGGEGTFFARGPGDVEALVQRGSLRRGERYLVRERIEGRPYGITIFVAPGLVALSAVRLQCYHPGAGAAGSRAFAGVQWIATQRLAPDLRRRIDATFLALGELLHRRRFFGFANVDFMVDARRRVFVIECNPRMSAATPQLLRDPSLISGVPTGALFLAGFTGPRRYPRSFERRLMPASTYEGATLDLVHTAEEPAAVARDVPIGRYTLGDRRIALAGPGVRAALGPRRIFLFSFARKGQVCRRDDTLGTIVSDAPLHDREGEPIAAARRLLAYFRYTDAR
jgi:ATP-grasp domain